MTTLNILFSDLVDFTPLTSDLCASRMARVLNEYLVRMTEVIYAHGGTIAQFSGDGILVIFGVPEEMMATRQAEQACACALVMHDAVNTPPAKAGGFRLRLKAGLIGHSADDRRYTTVKSSSGSGGF